MFTDQYEEHLDSQPDESRWDGFDRGLDATDYPADQGERIIGRMTNGTGQRVVIIEQFCDDLRNYQVFVGGNCVFDNSEDRALAIGYAHWLMNQA